MGAIKDIIDLTTQLSNSVNDRKLSGEISQIQSLISSVQSDNASLISENLELQKNIFELEKEIFNIQKSQSNQVSKLKEKYTFNKTYGIYKSNGSEHFFCTSCLLNNIESPLSEDEAGWRCQLKQCGMYYSNPSYNPPSLDQDSYSNGF